MKLREIITEGISLTRYKSNIHDAVNGSVITTLGYIKNLQDQHAETLDLVNRTNGNLSQLTSAMLTDTVNYLEQGIVKELKPVVFAIVDRESGADNRTNKNVNYAKDFEFSFDDTNIGGSAYNFVIEISKNLLVRIQKNTLRYLADYAKKNNYSEEALGDAFFASIDDTVENPQELLEYLSELTNQLTTTVIHEMVHIVQNWKQFKAGRNDKQYRSYLVKDPEKFYQSTERLNTADEQPDDWKWYHASPQEIAAYAHTIALDIIKDYQLSAYNIDSNTIIAYVKQHLKDSMPNPSTQQEVQIYRRYLKLAYQECMQYVQQ